MEKVTATIKHELCLKPLKHLKPPLKGNKYKINIGWYNFSNILMRRFYLVYGEEEFLKRREILNNNIKLLKHVLNYGK
jgi:hypothetical protein